MQSYSDQETERKIVEDKLVGMVICDERIPIYPNCRMDSTPDSNHYETYIKKSGDTFYILVRMGFRKNSENQLIDLEKKAIHHSLFQKKDINAPKTDFNTGHPVKFQFTEEELQQLIYETTK